jgi:uncharacterized protein (TIGR00369 family)
MAETAITVPLAELQQLFDQQGVRDSNDERDWSATPFAVTLTEVSDARVRARVDFRGSHQRPGGLVSGPVLFSIVDASGWLATVSRLEPGSEAITIDCTIRYLAPVPSGSLVTEAIVLRAGKRSVVSTVTIATVDEADRPRVHAAVSFAPVASGLAGIRERGAAASETVSR